MNTHKTVASILTGIATVALLAACAPSISGADPKAPTNDRGNYEFEIGQKATQIDESTGKPIMDLTVDSIAVDPPCAAVHPDPPENGHYVVLTVSVQTFAALSDTFTGYLRLDPNDFDVFTDTGTMANDSTSWNDCLGRAEDLSFSIDPQRKASGKIQLDAPNEHGSIAYTPLGDDHGWEWSY